MDKFEIVEKFTPKELYSSRVDKWYDKYSKNWIIQVLDIDGNEIECSYAGSKQSAEYDVKLFKEKYNL